MKYAGFWKRLAAGLLDCVIIGFIPGMMSKNSESAGLIGFVLATGYIVWMNGTYGATVGKMILKIKIVKTNGSKLNYNDALLRHFASYLSAAALLIGYLWVIWDPKKQAWHDKIAKTYVVKT